MRYWFDTSETITRGLGFSHFDPEHLMWLGAAVVFILYVCRTYRSAGTAARVRIRHWMAASIVGNEIFKTAMLLIGGNWMPEYLPLHLCSVNILLIAYHAVRPGRLLDNFLYAVCVPGAVAALLFPSWTKLPVLNFMYLHSFTVHILLAAYPLMLVAGGDLKPDRKYIPKCVLLLSLLALVALGANLLFDTNFMFLMNASKSNPLYVFKKLFGSHLVGFVLILPLVFGIMYLPFTQRHSARSPYRLV